MLGFSKGPMASDCQWLSQCYRRAAQSQRAIERELSHIVISACPVRVIRVVSPMSELRQLIFRDRRQSGHRESAFVPRADERRRPFEPSYGRQRACQSNTSENEHE